MEDKIVIDFEALDRFTGRLSSAAEHLQSAAERLSKLEFSPIMGKTLSPGADGFPPDGTYWSLSDVSDSVKSCAASLHTLQMRTEELRFGLQSCAAVFEAAERSLIAEHQQE